MCTRLPIITILFVVTLIGLQRDVSYGQSMEQELARAERHFTYGRRAESMPSVYGHSLPQAYEDALAIYRKYGVQSGQVVYVCNYLGIYYKRRGDYEKAMVYYDWGLPIAEKFKVSLDHLLINIGNLYSLRFQYIEALSYYNQASQVLQEEGDKETECNLLNALGLCHLNAGEYEKAKSSFERALTTAEAADYEVGIGATNGNLAILSFNQGYYQEAQEFDDAWSSIFQTRSDIDGKIKLARGEVDKSILVFRGLADSLLLGKAYLQKKDFSNSLKCFEAALKNEEIIWNDSNYLLATYVGLGQVFEGMGDQQSARTYYENATEMISTFANSLEAKQREDFLNVERYGFKRKDAFLGLERVLKSNNN